MKINVFMVLAIAATGMVAMGSPGRTMSQDAAGDREISAEASGSELRLANNDELAQSLCTGQDCPPPSIITRPPKMPDVSQQPPDATHDRIGARDTPSIGDPSSIDDSARTDCPTCSGVTPLPGPKPPRPPIVPRPERPFDINSGRSGLDAAGQLTDPQEVAPQ